MTRASRNTVRAPLTRERVIRAAIRLADESGLESLSMRRLGQALGVEAMSLYNHVANKEDILNGIAGIVLGEIELPERGADWKSAIRRTAISYHEVLMRHGWAAGLLLSPGRASEQRIRHEEAILRCLREGGFTPEVTDHAYHALESHIFGYTLWLVQMDFDAAALPDLATAFLAQLPVDQYPYLIEHVQQHLRPRDAIEDFAFGLDLILDGLERMRSAT